MNLEAVKASNAQRWVNCVITASRAAEVTAVATRLCAPAAKARYQAISQDVWGTPDRWFFVAVTHEREASQRWDRQLGQGDPLGQVSIHVPKGRGPFHDHDGQDAFHWGAVDALKNCPPFAGRWTDWSIGGVLTLLEAYNGFGYESHAEPSPYDWGATNVEQWGKYTGDGIYNAHVWDTQLGCAAMLKTMVAVDPSLAAALH